MESSTEQTQGLVEIRLATTVLVLATKLDTTTKKPPDKLCRGHDTGALVRNVVLHARPRVDCELCPLIDGASQTPVIVSSILALGVPLGVVDVLFGAVAAKTLGGDLEFAGTVAKGHEAQDAEEQTNGLGRHHLDGADIDGLGVVTSPVAEVGLLDHEIGELLAAVVGLGSGEAEQDVFDVAMAPYG